MSALSFDDYECPCGRGDGCDCDGMEQKAETEHHHNIDFSDLETDFDDIEAIDTSADEHEYIEKCQKCGGTGKWHGGSYRNPVTRTCFACNGQGHKIYQTSPEARKAARAKAQAKREEKAADKMAQVKAFLEANPALDQWFNETRNWSDFARSLEEALFKYGSLTEKQLAAAQKAAEKHTAKQQEKAQKAKDNAVEIDTAGLKPILEAFDTAKANGLKRPKIRLDGFQLSLAPATGRNAGHIYVKDGSEYLGKISPEGEFQKPYSLDPEIAKEIDEKLTLVGKNPMEAAVAYGKRTGECSCCGRELTRADSIERGMGAICAEKYGF